MADTLTWLQKRREFLLRSCQKLLKISLSRPTAKLVSKSCQNMSKVAKSWLPCPVHVQCIFSHLSIVYFGWKLNQEDKFLSQWATLSVLVLTNLSFFSNSYLRDYVNITAKLARQGWGVWSRIDGIEWNVNWVEMKTKKNWWEEKRENDDDRAVRIVEPVQASRSIYEWLERPLRIRGG